MGHSLWGDTTMKENINFLPEDYLQKKAQQRTNIICLLLFVVVISAVAAGWLLTESRRKTMELEKVDMEQKMALASDSLKKLDELEKQRKLMEEKAELSAMLTEAIPRSLLMATITNNLPQGVSLISYKLGSKEIKVAPAPVAKTAAKKATYSKKAATPVVPKIDVKKFQTEVDFVGLAGSDLEVAKLISDLSKSHLMSNVSLKFSEEHVKDAMLYKRFEISAIMGPEIRASEEDVMWARKQHIKSY